MARTIAAGRVAQTRPPPNVPLTDLSLAPAAWFRGDMGFYPAPGIWKDQSGNSKDTTPQSATRPIASNAINGKPTLSFPGSANQALVIPATTFGPFSIYSVFKLSGTVGYIFVTGDDGGATGGYLYGSTGHTINTHRSSVDSAKNLSSNWAIDGVAKSVIWTYDGTAAGHRLYIGGAQQSLSVSIAGEPGSATASMAVYIGASDTGTAPTTGHYGEVALYTGALTAEDISKLAAYSLAYWGV